MQKVEQKKKEDAWTRRALSLLDELFLVGLLEWRTERRNVMVVSVVLERVDENALQRKGLRDHQACQVAHETGRPEERARVCVCVCGAHHVALLELLLELLVRRIAVRLGSLDNRRLGLVLVDRRRLGRHDFLASGERVVARLSTGARRERGGESGQAKVGTERGESGHARRRAWTVLSVPTRRALPRPWRLMSNLGIFSAIARRFLIKAVNALSTSVSSIFCWR